ncbi:MAG: hypothetical protein PHR43_02415 [Dehalococcoidales bacterium]|nr:hypothetical protein [Dehalococcoidales bacterium]
MFKKSDSSSGVDKSKETLENKKGAEKMVPEVKPKKIMTQPLPQILDEIEDSIRGADEAAKDARKAAEEARLAGEKAANEAARVASEKIAKVEQLVREALALGELIRAALKDSTVALDKRLSGKQ